MNTIQETFTAVIEAGFYPASEERADQSYNIMCYALCIARQRKVITHEEANQAFDAIKDYLKRWSFLAVALDTNGLPSDIQSRLAIYKDWQNRPKLQYDMEDKANAYHTRNL